MVLPGFFSVGFHLSLLSKRRSWNHVLRATIDVDSMDWIIGFFFPVYLVFTLVVVLLIAVPVPCAEYTYT